MMKEREIVAMTLYMEARGEGGKGLQAVASVIHNRMLYNKSSLKKVCLAPKQFSCWNGKIFVEIPRNEVYRTCLVMAQSMTDGKFHPSHKFRHYYNPWLCSPAWAKQVKTKTLIGNHLFVKL
jgi:spore germination cell wall hydrolase CwlJ-like protein